MFVNILNGIRGKSGMNQKTRVWGDISGRMLAGFIWFLFIGWAVLVAFAIFLETDTTSDELEAFRIVHGIVAAIYLIVVGVQLGAFVDGPRVRHARNKIGTGIVGKITKPIVRQAFPNYYEKAHSDDEYE